MTRFCRIPSGILTGVYGISESTDGVSGSNRAHCRRLLVGIREKNRGSKIGKKAFLVVDLEIAEFSSSRVASHSSASSTNRGDSVWQLTKHGLGIDSNCVAARSFWANRRSELISAWSQKVTFYRASSYFSSISPFLKTALTQRVIGGGDTFDAESPIPVDSTILNSYFKLRRHGTISSEVFLTEVFFSKVFFSMDVFSGECARRSQRNRSSSISGKGMYRGYRNSKRF